MSTFQLVGLPMTPFTALFDLTDEQLATRDMRRVVASEHPGYPCRVSLTDAAVGEELLLLSFAHQPAASPYQASGPIYVRKGAVQAVAAVGVVPDYVRSRLMSVRAYDASHVIIDAAVCEGSGVAAELVRMLGEERVDYIHLHNAKRGCFACRVNRVG